MRCDPRRAGVIAGTLLILISLVLVPASTLASEPSQKIQNALLSRLITVETTVGASAEPLRRAGAPFGLHRTFDMQTNRIVVELISPQAADHVRAAIARLNGTVELTVRDKIQARLTPEAMEALARMSEVSFIRLPFTAQMDQGAIASEGIEITEAGPWHEAGFKGQGVKIGILDSGFLGYERLLGRELPPEERVFVRSFRPDGDIECRDCDRTSQVHGLAVAEIVYDLAPEATFYLVNFNTDVEMEAAVEWLIEEGVEVINTSFGFFTTGCPYEGTGFLDPIFESARAEGIFWAASAGNDARQHWAGPFSDPDGNGFINFAEDDESQTLLRIEEGDRVTALLWWDDLCRRAPHDYDLVLQDEEGNELERSFRAGPRNSWPLEALVSDELEAGTYELKLQAVEGSPFQRFSLLLLSHSPQYVVPEGSAGLMEPEMSRSVISVGATDLRNQLEPFSSQGPAPDGRIKPDLVAPDGVTNRTFRRFFGTSASSPHAAGAAALVKSAFPDFGPEEIQRFLSERAEDLGPPGPDGQFGAGLLLLGSAPQAQPKPPAAPSNLHATPAGPTEIDLEWQDNSDSEEGFIVERSRRLENQVEQFGEIARVGADVTRFSDTSVESGATYCYRVRAFNAQGTSDPSNEACVTTPQVNAPPVADAGPDQTVFVGTLVQLDGRASSDPDGDSLSFRWAFVERPQTSSAELDDPLSPTPAFVPDFEGAYVLELVVSDPQGATSSDRVEIRAVPRPEGGELLALKFTKLEFLDPSAWDRTLQDGCVIYRNIDDDAAGLRVTLADGSTREFDVPPDRVIIVCGDVVHIDTRAAAA